MPHLDRTATVAQIAAEHSGTRPVFRRWDIDYCCHGDATVGETCRRQRLPPDDVVADLERALAGAFDAGAARDARREAIVREVERHHAAERRALPYIASLLPKIAGRFRGRDLRLDVLCDAGEDLVEMLEAYIEDDERRLLPAAAAGACEAVRGELDRKNGELEAMLAHVRSLARDYVAPEWGDGAYRALMEELAGLEEDVRARVRVEERELVCEPPDAGGAKRARARPAARVWAEAAARDAADEEE